MNNEFLRHTLATIKYRFDKSVLNSADNFGAFSLGKGSRSPTEIINHIYDVLYSTRLFVEEERRSSESQEILTFSKEIQRFNHELVKMDRVLDHKELPINYAKKLLQGPFSDILTHIGQISMLQRLHDNPFDGEDFSRAVIETGMD